METTLEKPSAAANAEAKADSPAMSGSGTVYTTHHMCVDIAGVLRWPDKDLCRLFKDDDGSKKPGRVVRDWLKLQLAQGKRVLPMGEKCEGWSDVDGCPGHPRKPDESESPNAEVSDQRGAGSLH